MTPHQALTSTCTGHLEHQVLTPQPFGAAGLKCEGHCTAVVSSGIADVGGCNISRSSLLSSAHQLDRLGGAASWLLCVGGRGAGVLGGAALPSRVEPGEL